MSKDCRGNREKLADLAIGRLGDAEGAELEAHLETCPECRAEAARLTKTARLLPLVESERLFEPVPTPPAGLEKRIESQIRTERKGRRSRCRFTFAGLALAGTTAAVILAIVFAGGSTNSDTPATHRLAFDSVPAGVEINGSLRPKATGTEISLNVSGVRSGTLCRVFVRKSNGKLTPAGSFRYRYDESGEPSVLSTGVDLSNIRKIEIRAGSETFVQPV